MQTVLVSLVSLLAAAAIAAPASSVQERQLPGVGAGAVASPLTTILEEAGQQTPQALNKATDTLGNDQEAHQGKNSTAKPDTSSKAASADPISGLLSTLTGGLGGI